MDEFKWGREVKWIHDGQAIKVKVGQRGNRLAVVKRGLERKYTGFRGTE